MGRTPATPPATTAADIVLRGALKLMRPLVQLLVTYGVTYPRLAAALKRLYVDAARTELRTVGRTPTDTAISVLSGVHRKDVKVLAHDGPASSNEPPPDERPSLVSQVATRWFTTRPWLGDDGEPRPLPLRASSARVPSFEKLVESVSSDVHATALIDELTRLKLAEFDGQTVRLLAHSFVPPHALAENLDHFAANTRDQIAAAVANLQADLQGAPPRFLEYSLFSDELRPESVERLHQLAKTLWRDAFRQATDTAVALSDADRARGFADAPEMRMRFGVFFYAEPNDPGADTSAPTAKARS